ncbi:MAG: SpoIIE family protein phosphatase [Candidatus Kapaibacterium sp.]
MINLNNLDDNEKVFLNEFKIYSSNLVTAQSAESLDVVKSNYLNLINEYKNLLDQAVKLVKISDSNQLKLRKAQTILQQQNSKIEFQNAELQKSNDVQQKLLNVINRELSRAADYVMSILPEPLDLPDKGIQIDWKFQPSSKLGGDLFGYRYLDDSNLAIYLLDVCGHGVQSALYSVSVINTINYSNIPKADFYNPESVFCELNRIFDMRKHNDLYFTMWYGVYNLNSRTLHYSSAGHPPAVLVSGDNRVKLLEADNFFIGGVSDYNFESKIINLGKGDNLFIFSDGVYEIRKNENTYMDIKELMNFLRDEDLNNCPLENLYDFISRINFDKMLEDDFSIMQIKIK